MRNCRYDVTLLFHFDALFTKHSLFHTPGFNIGCIVQERLLAFTSRAVLIAATCKIKLTFKVKIET